MYNLPINDSFIDIYSRYLWIGNPLRSQVWMIWNEESWPKSIDEVVNKLFYDWLVCLDWKYDIENGISYKHDLTFDKTTWYTSIPEECKDIYSYYFTKDIEYILRLTSNKEWMKFLNRIETSTVYFYYLEFIKLIQDKHKDNKDIFKNVFLWEFYFLPSITNEAFDIIYKTSRKEFYKKYSSILSHRCEELKNILDNEILSERKKIFFWGDWKDKILMLSKVFWDFKKINNGQVSLMINDKNHRKSAPIYYCDYEWHQLFICPFIKYISNIKELVDIIKEPSEA